MIQKRELKNNLRKDNRKMPGNSIKPIVFALLKVILQQAYS